MSHVDLECHRRLKQSRVRNDSCREVDAGEYLGLLLPEAKTQIPLVVKHVRGLDLLHEVLPQARANGVPADRRFALDHLA